MAIEFFKPQYRTIQNPVDLNVLASTYNTLESKHLQAVELESKYKQALQELPLHPNEDAWVAQQGQAIQSAFNDNLNYGNAAAALDDLVRVWGDIKSNPGMKGRLRANQEYQNYMTNLEANKTLDEDTKAYYREKNKYYYQDTYDKNGNIIGGTEWKPLEREVDTIPMHEIYNQALKWAATEKGGGNSVTFLDANGNPTKDVRQSATGEIYTSVSGNWVKLGKDKLMAAVNAAIESIPGAKASIAQDYKIAKWKYDEYGTNSDVTDKSGYLLTPEQYLAKRINPFIESATYFNQTSTVEYGSAWKAQLALANKQRTGDIGGGLGAAKNNLMTTTTNPLSINNFMPTQAASEVTSGKQTVANALLSANPDLNFNLDNISYDDTKKLIADNVIDPVVKMQAIQALEQYTDAQEYLNSLKIGKDENDQAAFDTYNAIMSMSVLPTNDFTSKYDKFVNNIFGDASSLRQYFKYQDTYDEFINSLGGEQAAKKLGITFGVKDGVKYAQLGAANKNALYSFAKATTEAENLTRMPAWQGLKARFGFAAWDDVARRVDAQGNESSTGPISTVGTETYAGLLNYVDTTLKRGNDNILDGGKINPSMNTVLEFSPTAAELRMAYQSGAIKAADFNAQYKLATDDATRMRSTIDFTQTGLMIIDDETNTYRRATSEEAKEYTARVRNAKDNETEFVMGQDFETGQWSPFITLKDKEKPVTMYAPGGYDNADIQSWNRDTRFRALNDIGVYHASNRPLNLTNSSAFANMDKFSLIPDGVGFNLVNKTDNKVVNYVNREQAAQLRDVYHQWNDTYNAVTSGVQGYTVQAVQAIALNTAQQLAMIDGSAGNKDVITYYYQQLISNLKGY